MIDIEKEGEIKLEINYGFAYKLNNNFALGFEAKNKSVYEDDKWEYSVLSAGPGLSYNIEGFWLNLSCLPQITDLNTGKLDLNHNEKVQTRLIFSYSF